MYSVGSAKSGLLILSRQMYSVGFALDLLLVRVDEEVGAKEEVEEIEDVIELDDVIEVEEVELVKGKERMSVEA